MLVSLYLSSVYISISYYIYLEILLPIILLMLNYHEEKIKDKGAILKFRLGYIWNIYLQTPKILCTTMIVQPALLVLILKLLYSSISKTHNTYLILVSIKYLYIFFLLEYIKPKQLTACQAFTSNDQGVIWTYGF